MRIINWNVKWASANSKWGPVILEEILSRVPEVVCITEGYKGFMDAGYTITSHEDYGYKLTPGRRKVMLWSKNPWKYVDTIGSESLPGGRFVSGLTSTSRGDIRFIGVCIPWRDAHARTGRKDKGMWEEHISYLKGLREIIDENTATTTILLGDFNERIPRFGQPENVFNELIGTIPGNLTVATTGSIPTINKPTIDHVCHTKDLVSKSISTIENKTKDGQFLSDHFGVVVEFYRK